MLWDEYAEKLSINDICALFGWLIRQLSDERTLFCIVDGVKSYERDKYYQDFVEVLAFISKSAAVGCSVLKM